MEDLIQLSRTDDGRFEVGKFGVVSVETPADRKVEFVTFEEGGKLACIKSAMGYPAIYPVHDVKIEKPALLGCAFFRGSSAHLWN